MILGTKSNQLPILPGSIPDEQLILVPDPVNGELKRSTFGQVKADIILAIGDLSYLDDIIEVPTIADLPQPGQIKKIYVITTGLDANKQFRWGGSIYIEFPQGSGDVAAEAVIRGNADTTLQANIDAETAARIAADSNLQTNINNEATSRQNADTTLQNNLSAEANTRATNDSILQGMINTEASIRANADNDIDTRLDALESAGPGGPSLPSGGTSGQLLQKNSSTDDDASWSSTIPDEVTSLNADVANLESAVTTLTTDVANIRQSHFLGVFLTLAALVSAVPSPIAGDYADIDAGTGTDTLRYIYDVDDDKWVAAGAGTPLTAAQVKTLYESNANTNAYTDFEKTKLSGIETGAQANDPNTTTQGNTFNAANKLVQLDAGAKLPAVDGSQLTNLPAGGIPYVVASGTNTYTAAPSPALTAYFAGLAVSVKSSANTGASTLNLSSLGAKAIQINGVAVKAGDIQAGVNIYVYDGTAFQLQRTVLPNGALKVYTTDSSGVAQTTYGFTDLYLPAIDDSAGRKTNAQMNSAYPTAVEGNRVRGANGTYEYFGLFGWVYYSFTII